MYGGEKDEHDEGNKEYHLKDNDDNDDEDDEERKKITSKRTTMMKQMERLGVMAPAAHLRQSC